MRPTASRPRIVVRGPPGVIVQILGIVNLTRDSFSDGGRFVEPDAALEHARRLRADGADIIDLGAESTHPDAEHVPADAEIERLSPIVSALKRDGAFVSVDTYKPLVMRAVLALGADLINDVRGLREPGAIDALRAADCRIILMHSSAAGPRAERVDVSPLEIVDRVRAFFEERIATLTTAGIARERLILDPGMGFFLGRDPLVSLTMLRDLHRLRALKLPICLSTSRKSFIGTVLADAGSPRPVEQRAAGTLATELWAAVQGVEYIRTHDAGALRDAWRLWRAIDEA